MKKTFLITIVAALLFFISCNKDDAPEMLPQECDLVLVKTGLVTTPGSYWIYDWYEIDSMGVETLTLGQDTITVIGDTLINGNIYSHHYGNKWGSSTKYDYLKRDSLGYIIDEEGVILYSYVNFTDTLIVDSVGTYWDSYSVMEEYPGETFITPAGFFETIAYESHYYRDNGEPLNSCGDLELVLHTRYDLNIGEVEWLTTFSGAFTNDCSLLRRELVEYYIEE